MLDHMRAREGGNFGRVVRRPVVDDDDLFGELLGAEHHGANRWTLVEGRDCS